MALGRAAGFFVWVYSGGMGEIIHAGGLFGGKRAERAREGENTALSGTWQERAEGERAENLIFAEALEWIHARESMLHAEISSLKEGTGGAGAWFKGGDAAARRIAEETPTLRAFLEKGEGVHDPATWLNALQVWLRQKFGLAAQVQYALADETPVSGQGAAAEPKRRETKEVSLVFSGR